MKIAIRAAARREISMILEYSAQYGPMAAGQWLHEFEKALKLLSEYPESGARRPMGVLPDLRMLCIPSTKYQIYYQIESQRIDMLRIVHGNRDVKSILKEIKKQSSTDE